ncbi:TPA: hypothetical protein U1391_000253 [Streptococcus suis]|uniref:ABC-2 family transporter protein n=1 Tax=Streptococcus suis TaxID=1307 RepID=A0AB33U4J4_STRSU|nr:hypothetical protein [Streptococcus suis]MDW8767492.1 hypothetical protein [Streptococcus suis]NQH87196.1 hypothetical protein [Streptococcus suis]NQN18055.1 hypothetical protein [Streptococcus suis]NQR72122.1 hypothetical protein [Streptococcus suis]CYU88892.1 ABC-2 family transporter protein [Streptococcus suis]
MFQIEGKLFFHSKKNLFAILVMLMTILSSSLLAGYHNRQAKLKVIQHYEQSIQNFENIIQDLETQYQNQALSEEDYQAEQTFFTNYIANYQKEIEAVKKEDWTYFYEKNIQHYQQDGQYISLSYRSYEFTPQTIENTFLISKYLLEKEIPSAFPINLYLTAFEHPKTPTDREIVKSLGQQALKGTSHEIWQGQKQLGLVITLPLFLLAFTNFFIKDQQGTSRQIRLLQTLGLTRIRITTNKYLAFLTLYTALFLTLYLSHFLIAFLLNGNSSWIYPVTTYSSNGLAYSFITTAIKPIYQVILLACGMHYLYLLFLLGLAQTLARVLKNGLAGLVVTLGLVISANFYPHIFNPFSLWNAGNLADGSAIIYHQLTGYSIPKVFTVLLISNLLIYCLQFYLLTRKSEV